MRVKLYVSDPGLAASQSHRTIEVKHLRALRRAATKLAKETGKVVHARSVQPRASFVRLTYRTSSKGRVGGQAHAESPYCVYPESAAKG